MPRKISRRICFVSGTRAEFGLMHSTLKAISAHPALQLQLVLTGMHLDRQRGRSANAIRQDGWTVDALIPWARGDGSEIANAVATGKAVSTLASTFARIRPEVVLVTGDRVEAFAAASAAHICGILVAHVHGGDRALGLVDDSLRHAITKLSHIHFPATSLSARRIEKMGEDRWRIFRAGSPGLDNLRTIATPWSERPETFKALERRRYALVILHPESTNVPSQNSAARTLAQTVHKTGFDRIVIVYPNNDPGSAGIAGAWKALTRNPAFIIRRDIPRPLFLGLLREAAVLIGNSSSGIIEAATFGTPVLDIGKRQEGRQRGENVFHAEMCEAAISRQLQRIWQKGRPVRFKSYNIYGKGGAGRQIASTLADIIPSRFLPKLITY